MKNTFEAAAGFELGIHESLSRGDLVGTAESSILTHAFSHGTFRQ